MRRLSVLVGFSFLQITSLLFLAALGCTAPAPPPETTDGDWLARVQRHLAEREYRASENDRGLQAPNRAHNLRTYFEPTGVRVHDRTSPGSPLLAEIRLEGLGRGADIAAVASGEVFHEGSRVELRRAGMTEWFENGPSGVEHGLTLEARPAGEGELVVELAVKAARAELRGARAILTTPTGRRLGYGKLVVWDAEGETLAARLASPAPDRLQIVVADSGATYPLTIDPLLTGVADTEIESDGIFGRLGESVAGAGDVDGDGFADVIVGAPEYDAGEVEEGSAFVFHGSATGIADGDPSSSGVTHLESNQAAARFGESVAGAGDVDGDGYGDVIVGAPHFMTSFLLEGLATLFPGSGSGVVGTTPASAGVTNLNANLAGALFGTSVAGAGDVDGDGYSDVIVGAPGYTDDDTTQDDEGSAFVFPGSGTGLVGSTPGSTGVSELESNQADALMGWSVDGAGDVNGDGYADVIVGAPKFGNSHSEEGAAFVFHGSASGVPDGDPTTDDAQMEINVATSHLGWSVAGAGDVNGDGYSDVIVGAPSNEGVYVWEGSASGIDDTTLPASTILVEIGQPFPPEFGYSVDGIGDVNGDGYADVAMGAPFFDSGESDEGAVFVFFGSDTGILNNFDTTFADVQLESNEAAALFGTSVAGAGDVNRDGYADLIVGAPRFFDSESHEGMAFVFHGGASGIEDGDPSNADTQLEANVSEVNLGFSVAGAGDVNGDGYSDVIVGAPDYDAGESEEGAAFVFLGSATGIADGDPTSPGVAQLESDQIDASMGESVAGAGDVNGDGYSDVIVGAPRYDDSETDEGAAFVFLGSASGIADSDPGSPGVANLVSKQGSSNFGGSVAGAGDLNGDGRSDVIVGARFYNGGDTNEGAAFVFLAGASGIADGDPTTADGTIESNLANSFLGKSVAGAGDVNGDGLADVIVGAPSYADGEAAEGAAFVFHGSPTGVGDGDPTTADAQLESNLLAANLGDSVAGAGDVNGDGFADVIVGAPGYDDGENNEGAAFVFLGSATGVADSNPSSPGVAQLESDQIDARLGESVAGAGDVNGDGFADVIVGTDDYDDTETAEGVAFVFLGSASGVADGNPATAAAQFESNQDFARFGASVAGAGDVNGDGFADIIVGARFYDDGNTNEGAAFIFYGNEGRPVLTEQLRGGVDDTPVQPWGISQVAGEFRVEMTATHPEGRGRAKLEVEACPVDVAFGDASCSTEVSSTWVDVTATAGGVVIPVTLSGLDADELYRWRARTLRAPLSVTEAGITPPPNPEPGPWRRLKALSREADVRVPEPGIALQLASGALLLGWLDLMRRRRRARVFRRA